MKSFENMLKHIATRKTACAGQLLKSSNIAIKVDDGDNNELLNQSLRNKKYQIFNVLVA